MNTTINRLIALGYTREKAECLYKLYSDNNQLRELEEYIALKESQGTNEPSTDHCTLSY